jgi:hypothetical protein
MPRMREATQVRPGASGAREEPQESEPAKQSERSSNHRPSGFRPFVASRSSTREKRV